MLHPIMEWGQPLPNDELELMPPHPFRQNSLLSAYPSILDLARGRFKTKSHDPKIFTSWQRCFNGRL